MRKLAYTMQDFGKQCCLEEQHCATDSTLNLENWGGEIQELKELLTSVAGK